MTLWRLEWLRLIRTRRWIALVAVYLFFGLLGPISAKYLGEILARFGGGIEVTFPDPVPADGIAQFAGDASQIGLLISVVVAAGALCLDATPEIGTFFRTRVPDLRRILTPRLVVTVTAVLGAFALGTAAAWYETVVLIGRVPIGALWSGWFLTALYLVFAMTLVGAVAARTRSVLTTVLITLLILLGLPILGIAPDVGRWLPSHLLGAMDGLVRGGQFGDYLRAAGVTALLSMFSFWLAVAWNSRRET